MWILSESALCDLPCRIHALATFIRLDFKMYGADMFKEGAMSIESFVAKVAGERLQSDVLLS